MIVDPLTKGLSPEVFRKYVAGMGLKESLYSGHEGHLDTTSPYKNMCFGAERCTVVNGFRGVANLHMVC